MLKILIADNHPIAKEGLRHILADFHKKALIHDVDNREDLFSKIESCDYDLVFLELEFLDCAPLYTIEKIKKMRAQLPILIFTSLPEDLFAMRTLRNGASGYISKSSSAEELLLAINRVLSGKKYVSHVLAERIANNFSEEREVLPYDKLSNREYEVMLMIACGKEIKNIAELLTLSPRTVSIYRKRILKKMNLKNNAAISIFAIRHGLVEKMKDS